MLANSLDAKASSGSLGRDVHLQNTSRYELIKFISNQLPLWRDDKTRKPEKAETALTSQLCAHLNTAARLSSGWDTFQFRPEETDEKQKGRKIDLVAAPCGATIWIDGRSFSHFDPILPIECKRLPTPKERNRDEWEYVINRNASTGGIQRFKTGYHGSGHKLAAMIAYVQEGTPLIWDKNIAEWIQHLIKSGQPGWTSKDFLRLETNDEIQRVAILQSVHDRDKNLGEIELHHLWITMNPS